MSNDFFLYIPNHYLYTQSIFECLHNKKFQIHKCFTDAEKITLVATLHFEPEIIQTWFTEKLGVEYIEKFPTRFRWEVRTAKPKRKYTLSNPPQATVNTQL